MNTDTTKPPLKAQAMRTVDSTVRSWWLDVSEAVSAEYGTLTTV